MPHEKDVRNFDISNATEQRAQVLRESASASSGLLPGAHKVEVAAVDPLSGNAAVIVSVNAPAHEGNFVQRALEHVQTLGRAMGLTPTQPVEFQPDPHFQETSSGGAAVHLQQHYKAIPVFDAAHTVRFKPDGAIDAVVGRAESVVTDVPATPRLSPEEAVRKVAEFLAAPDEVTVDPFGAERPAFTLELDSFDPQVVASFSDPTHSTVLSAPPLDGALSAGLVWFKLGDDLRLSWEILTTLPNRSSQYRTVVDAYDGEVHYAREQVRALTARGNVYRLDGSKPREMIEFPPAWDSHGLPLPADLGSKPPDWVGPGNQTQGNSVRAHIGDAGAPLTGTSQDGVVVFDPSDATGDPQKILNIFYYCCVMRDFFYLLGFREADGNFQLDNFGKGGLPGDPVDARAYPGPVDMTANMLTLVDGSSPIMKMGLFSPTERHTAFDATVVFHEFTHGVTNRLVGGPLNVRALEAPQSSGMGEGWSDFFACCVTKQNVVGGWLTGQPTGIRTFAYDESFPVAQNNFGSVGTGRYTDPHSIGELWCACLMAASRAIGQAMTMQLVVDALKVAPANPSFVDMRDAILAALDAKLAAGQMSQGDHGRIDASLWEVFATFGLGPNASSNGPSLSGIRADFTAPDTGGTGQHGTSEGQPTKPTKPEPTKPADPGGVGGAVEVSGSQLPNGFELTVVFREDRVRRMFKQEFPEWLQKFEERAAQQTGLDHGGASPATSEERIGYDDSPAGLSAGQGERIGYEGEEAGLATPSQPERIGYEGAPGLAGGRTERIGSTPRPAGLTSTGEVERIGYGTQPAPTGAAVSTGGAQGSGEPAVGPVTGGAQSGGRVGSAGDPQYGEPPAGAPVTSGGAPGAAPTAGGGDAESTGAAGEETRSDRAGDEPGPAAAADEYGKPNRIGQGKRPRPSSGDKSEGDAG